MSFDDFAMGAISSNGPEFWDLINLPENEYDRYIEKLLAEKQSKEDKQWLIDAIDSIDKQHLWTNLIDPIFEQLESISPVHKGKDLKLWSDPKDLFG